MADGFDIHLNEEQAQRLKVVAEAAGVDPAAYVVGLIDEATQAGWAEDERRFAEYQQTGESVGAGEWLQGLREMVDRKFEA